MAKSDNTPDKKDPMVDFVVEEFKRYELHHRDRFEKAAKIYDYWTNKPPRRNYDWQNAVHIPMMLEAEQTISPRLFSALFPNEAPIDLKVFGNASEEQAIIIRDTIRHQFVQSDVQGEAIPVLSQCSLFGTGYVEASWLVERKWQVSPTGERYQAIVSNRNDCKSVNFFELYPHPAKMRMRDPLPLIRRRYVDAEYLKGLSDNPNFKIDNLDAALNSDPVYATESVVLDKNAKPLQIKNREKYELLEYWGPWDMSYTKDNEVVTKRAVPHWIIIVNRSVKIRGIPNPFNFQSPPFCKVILFPDANPSWFGIGIGQIGAPTQERLNKIVNQRLDNVDLVLNKQGFYNGSDLLINTKKLQVSRPGQWHKVSDTVTSIRWMETPDVTSSSYKEEEIAKADFRESTGATMPLMPTDQGQHRTAMGINLLQGAAGMRFRPVLRKMETDFVAELSMMYLSNLQQFMAIPQDVIVVMPNGEERPVRVTPEMIQAKVHWIPMGVSESLNKEVQIGQLLRFKELTVNDPTVNRQEINKRIAEYMGFKDIPKLLTPMKPTQIQQGGLAPNEQQLIQQRLAEGATPDQIRLELLGQPPGVEQQQPAGAGAR